MTSLRRRIARIRSVRALINLGDRRARKGDRAGAAEAFQLVTASRSPRHEVDEALQLWIQRSEADGQRAADEAYVRAADVIRYGEDETLAEKSLGVGVHIAAYQREFIRPARLAFQRSIDSGDRESVPLAAMGLAGLELQDIEENHGADIAVGRAAVEAALLRVIDSGHPDYVAAAATWLAFVSDLNDDVRTARIALSAAMDSGDLERGCEVALGAGEVFKRKGHTADAITALRFVVDNDQTGRAMIAAQDLGELLAAQGDVEGARTAYQFVLDRSTYPHVIRTVRAALDRL